MKFFGKKYLKLNEKEKKTSFLLLLTKGVLSDVYFCTAKNKAGSSNLAVFISLL